MVDTTILFHPPPPDQISPKIFVGATRATVQMRYVSLAILVALLWDIALSLDREVDYLQSEKFSLAKLCWVLNRTLVPVNQLIHVVVSIIGNTSDKACDVTGQLTEWLSVLNIVVIQIVLCLRVAALYRLRPVVCIPITILLVAATIARIASQVIWSAPFIVLRVGSSVVGCETFPDGNISYGFLGIIILDTVLWLMTIGRYFDKGSGAVVTTRLGRELLFRLFRDGSIYYLISAASITAAFVGFHQMMLLGPFTASQLYLGLMSITCSHMMLNLRDIDPSTRGRERRGVSTLSNVPYSSSLGGGHKPMFNHRRDYDDGTQHVLSDLHWPGNSTFDIQMTTVGVSMGGDADLVDESTGDYQHAQRPEWERWGQRTR